MAYRRRRTTSTRRRSTGRYARTTKRRRTRVRRASRGAQRIVIQLVGGVGGAVPIGVTAGVKGKQTLRPRL